MKIMKDHGLDGSTSNRLNYENTLSQLKPKTPVIELFNMVRSDSIDVPTAEKEKMTVQKPFDFQTAKRIRVQNLEQELCDDGDIQSET